MSRTYASFWNRIAPRYARQPVADETSYQHKLAKTREHLQPGMQVLEFGCGTGSTALAHASQVGHLRALDSSEGMIDIATGKARDAGVDNVNFECGAIETLDAPAGSFDAVLGMSILHLLQDPSATVARVYELLAPGGVFCSSTACIGEMGLGYRAMAGVMGLLPLLPRIKVFRVEELRAYQRQAGFDIEYEWQPGPDKAVFMIARKPV